MDNEFLCDMAGLKSVMKSYSLLRTKDTYCNIVIFSSRILRGLALEKFAKSRPHGERVMAHIVQGYIGNINCTFDYHNLRAGKNKRNI